MAEIRPLTALVYDQAKAGILQDLWSPPYDVIDADQRLELAKRSQYNAVRIDLPVGDTDPYETAAETLKGWVSDAALVRDPTPAIWALEQDYTGPDGRRRTRRGFLCKVRIEPYGAGRVRPHERTHPGPKEDRLRLIRATRCNLSPIFALFDDAQGLAAKALEPPTAAAPWGEVTDGDGTVHRVWRVAQPDVIEAVAAAARDSELLIADGHHRYETARVFAEEQDGDGEHSYVLTCLVAVQDPGLTVFPTHRLVRGTSRERQEALRDAIRRDWEVEEVAPARLDIPPADGGPMRIGYMDSFHKQPYLLTLKEGRIAQDALPDRSPGYRTLDTAVLETLLLRGALGLDDDAIDHQRGFGYARDTQEAIAGLESGEWDAGFFMAPIPVRKIQEVAAAGESMPPKSTYFFPKVITGLVFNPLD